MLEVILIAGCDPVGGASPTNPPVCDGIPADMGGCDSSRPVFAGTTCEAIADEWVAAIDERVLPIISGPPVEDDLSARVGSRTWSVLSSIVAGMRLDELGLLDSCDAPTFLEAGATGFSNELNDGIGATLFDGQPPASREDWDQDTVQSDPHHRRGGVSRAARIGMRRWGRAAVRHPRPRVVRPGCGVCVGRAAARGSDDPGPDRWPGRSHRENANGRAPRRCAAGVAADRVDDHRDALCAAGGNWAITVNGVPDVLGSTVEEWAREDCLLVVELTNEHQVAYGCVDDFCDRSNVAPDSDAEDHRPLEFFSAPVDLLHEQRRASPSPPAFPRRRPRLGSST